ncbi:MAG: RnfABCDGE type electron transport complex subunit D [Kiritimatiellae bacterium]|nr:RnfABCDGE type electron transport complex subunit D [Kiritimatiellia bacterium]
MKPKETAEHYILSSSPHAHARCSVSRIMLDVLIALLPTTAAGIWFFGMPAVWTIATCVATCLAAESLCRLAMKRENTVGDLSAVVTGLLLALNLPAGIPLWMAAVGSVFAIAVCKQVFGGLGMNPFNPALAARAFMLISFTGPMTTWMRPIAHGCDAATHATDAVDAMTCATPLAFIKKGDYSQLPDLWNLLIGNMPGCIGEVSALALAIGAVYLLWRKVITWHVPVAFLAATAVFAALVGAPIHAHLLTGGVMIGACFMATDYVTSPITAKGKLIFGVGCGVLCMAIRRYGSYPEGCSFAILIMNAVAPLINRWTQPKPFGAKK